MFNRKSWTSRLATGGLVASAALTTSLNSHAQSCTVTTGACLAYNAGAGVAVFGEATGNIGVDGRDTSSGIGVIGVSSTGTGVFGCSGENGCSQLSGDYGGYFEAPGSSVAALYGNATASGGTGVYGTGYAVGVSGSSGNGYGLEGTSSNADAIHGIYQGSGGSSAVAGIANSSGNGVYGSADNANYFGVSSWQGNASGYSAFFNGGLGVDIPSGASYYYGGKCAAGACTSDRRLKKNIEPVKGALDTLLKLRGVTYEWKNPEERGNQAGTQTGFIAQEVESAFPQWISENSQGYKAIFVPPMQIAALEVESIRTLQLENDELRERVKSLETGRPPLTSGIGGGIGLGLLPLAGVWLWSIRKRRSFAQAGAR
jgi:hypothetical protein